MLINRILLISCLLSPAISIAMPDLSKYSLVFSDEFNSPSTTIDQTKWTTAPLWGPYVRTNGEEQYYVDTQGINQGFGHNPFEISNGVLKISARTTASTLDAPNQPPVNDPAWDPYEYQHNPNYDTSNRNYLSGIITSNGSFDFTHGYIEVRAKIPSGQGLWPAFRLLTTKYVEDAPQIDIMQNFGQSPNEILLAAHYFDIANNWTLISTPPFSTSGPDYSLEFHTYAVAWEPHKVTWLIDGKTVKTVTQDDFKIAKQSMYIMAGLAVGGTLAGGPGTSTQFPATFEIDYIRAYQKTPLPLITPTILADEYELFFEDNFDPLLPAMDIYGTGLDPSKWKTQYLWGPYFRINLENQLYIDSHGRHQQNANNPVEVLSDGAGNSVLRISADTVDPAQLPVQPPITDSAWQLYPSNKFNPDYLKPDGWTPLATSGVVTSYDSFKFVKGYVEVRAKVPAGNGLWPAIWLLHGYYVGPQPEIDIMELQGEDPGTTHHSYHYFDSLGVLTSTTSTFNFPGNTGSFADDYHIYGVQWDRGRVQWYVDGVITRVLNGPEVSTQLTYVLMNLAVGGTFVNYSGIDALPANFDIDYVRVYQRNSVFPDLPAEFTTLILPSGPVDEQPQTFTWEAVDHADDYRLYVVDVTSGNPDLLSNWQTAASLGCINKGEICSYTPGPSYLGLKKWRIRARNSVGQNEWSNAVQFSVGMGQWPATVTNLTTPRETIEDLTPDFNWTGVDNAVEYRIIVVDVPTGVTELLSPWISATAINCSGTQICSYAPEFAFSGNKKWRVQARNPIGKNAWSTAEFFFIEGELPGQISTTSPTGNITASLPDYVWEADAIADRYRLVVRNLDTGLQVVNQLYSASEADCESGTGNCSVPSTINVTGNLRWWVQPRNSSGKGPWSVKRNFVVSSQ